MRGHEREGVVLIGAGGFGECWFPALERLSDRVRVVGVVEPVAEVRAAAGRRFGLTGDQLRSTAADGLDGLEARLVIDSSPFPNRRANVRAALAAGLDMLLAKPMAPTLADAEAVVAEAAAARRSVAVAQQMRYFPCFLTLREIVADKRYGSLRSARVRMALDGRGWEPGTEWRLALPHALLMEAGIHHLDLLRWVLGDVDLCSAVEDNPPWSPFASGARVSARLRASGAEVDYAATFAPGPGEAAVRFDSGWRLEFDHATVVAEDGGVLVDGARLTGGTADPVSLEALNDTVLAAWLDARRAGAEPPFSGADNLASMRLLDGAIGAVGRSGAG